MVALADVIKLRSRDVARFSFADQDSHAFKVRINLNNIESRLSPGMLAKVNINAGVRQSVRVLPRHYCIRMR